jgi:hypothetical protein
MKPSATGIRNVQRHWNGYRVQIVRGRKMVFHKYFTGPDALQRAIAARDSFEAEHPVEQRTNTGVVGVNETTYWRRDYSSSAFLVTWYEGRRQRQRRIVYGRRRTRAQALQMAIALRKEKTAAKDAHAAHH